MDYQDCPRIDRVIEVEGALKVGFGSNPVAPSIAYASGG